MNRIERVFADRGGRPLIIPFVTAGYPELDSTVPLVQAMVVAGADVVEIGMPFSDPLADGPTIQRSSERALSNGMTVARVLSVVAELRAAVMASDGERLRQAAHTLKSSSASIGASGFSAMCKELEALARDGRAKDAVSSLDVVEFEFEFEAVCAALSAEISRQAAA